MAHCLDQFGPTLQEPYCRMEAPPLTPDLRAALIEGAERETAGRPMAEMERVRDETIVRLLRARTTL
jgi:carnitine 3-dehydrogenase